MLPKVQATDARISVRLITTIATCNARMMHTRAEHSILQRMNLSFVSLLKGTFEANTSLWFSQVETSIPDLTYDSQEPYAALCAH